MTKRTRGLAAVVLSFVCLKADDCAPPPASASGVSKATVTVETGSDGLTVEQRNVRDRLTTDNKPGSIKHLYVISAYSGQVLIYSTVRGKVTSSGKRLTPTGISGIYSSKDGSGASGFGVELGSTTALTHEVLQDDGTYGTSDPYIYWWDSRGVYHQHYIAGGQIVHVTTEPMAVKGIVINLEQR